jgi:hypothetical protein
VYSNDFVFGMNDSGDMNLDLVLRILRNLPPGVTEIYFHPATPKINHKGKDSCGHRDYEALTSPELRQALLASSIPLIAFSDLWE